MFTMTSDIQIAEYKVKANSVKWRTTVLSPVDTCTIILPRATYVKNNLVVTEDNTTASKPIFNEGDKVTVYLGYDNRNEKRFVGFIKRINIQDKLEIECEGYSYQLPKIFNKSYANATIKDILTDLTEGTDIKLSSSIPNSSLGAARFKNFSGYQVLEWFRKECYLTDYFDFDTLYIGTRYGLYRKNKIALRLGWNTVDDSSFKKRKSSDNVIINIIYKEPVGTTKRIKSDSQKYSQVKDKKIKRGVDEQLIKQIANDLQTRENYSGYEGYIICFLEPIISKSCVIDLADKRFTERTGQYFVEELEGSFDEKGGRQKITLSYFGYMKAEIQSINKTVAK